MTAASRGRVVAACVLASGAAALLYEVVWLRLLGYAFGSTVHATSVVLFAFLGGLAVGGLALGRVADRVRRPLRVYAALELAIAGWCAATPLTAGAVDAAYAAVLRTSAAGSVGSALAQLVLGTAALAPPAVGMGMTLPLLARWVVGAGAPAGAGVSRLYAVNTWGGVAGTIAAAFWLIPALGVRGTAWAGALMQAVAALAAWAIDRGPGPAGPPTPAEPAAAGGRGPRSLLVAAAVSGAVAMVLEVAWTRALAPVLSSSVYAFSAMLASFLTGIAGGAWAVARAVRRRDPGPFEVGIVQAAAGVAVLAVLPLVPLLPATVVSTLAWLGPSFRSAVLVQLGASFAVMIVPALLVGATLPLAAAAWLRRPGAIGADVGAVFGANGVGTAAGVVAGGLLLVPALGSQRALVAAGLASVLSGAALAATGARSRARGVIWAVGLAQLGGLLALAPGWEHRLMSAGAAIYAELYAGSPDPVGAFRVGAIRKDVLLFEEGLHSTVGVFRDGGRLSMSVNGKVDGSTDDPDMRTQLLLGHLPALLHPAPRRAFVVGLGTGVTAGALAAHPVEEIVVAEIEPAVIRGAALFSAANRGVLEDPRVVVRVGDARHVLAAERGRFDVIVSEPSNPWIAGIGNLFTREMFLLARSRLAPGGLVLQWLHAYGMSIEDVKVIAATFRSVFPHATLWRASRADLFLVGTEGPLALDPRSLDRRIAASPAVGADLSRVLGDPGALPWTFVLAEDGVRRLAAGAPLNTDDRPILEYSAPRSLMGADVEATIRAIRAFRTEEVPFAPGTAPPLFETAAWRLHLARVLARQGASDDAAEQLARLGAPAALPFAARVERVRILHALDREGETVAELVALREAAPGDEELARLLSRALAPGPAR